MSDNFNKDYQAKSMLERDHSEDSKDCTGGLMTSKDKHLIGINGPVNTELLPTTSEEHLPSKRKKRKNKERRNL